VASVVNIDWPARKGLSVEEQKGSFISLLDQYKELGLNAVIFQVRPCADAFYPSTYEPWSEWLNGKQGLPPQPYYDPLQFMIEAAHQRGLEFHAWINPYRAVFNANSNALSPTHISIIHPEWFVTYGDKKYFNPGLPQVVEYVNNIVKDIIQRYDIDGLHMDDYFYPYRITGVEFPDAAAYSKYGKGMSKDAWRRSNCDSVVKRIHETILAEKPNIKFGISPFGVWRNESMDAAGSKTKAGVTNYDDLYADILLWMREKWIDYVAPQLYWEINHPLCDYYELTQWWAKNANDVPVYVGHGIYRVTDKPTAAWKSPNELPRQIERLRQFPAIQGSIFFSSKSLLSNPNGWADSLMSNYYRFPALIPPIPWIDTVPPGQPVVKKANVVNELGSIIVEVVPRPLETEKIKLYAVYAGNTLSTLLNHPVYIAVSSAKGTTSIDIPTVALPDTDRMFLTITAIDRENNEGTPARLIELRKESGQWRLVNN
jgi:uncharacterized lipoprotein YddW (UPF0748 family)